MNTIRQKCRPKHQVLILKCYPRFQKNAVEIKPNSSELSYLLYYVSTRRSKLEKVGAFLEKKTISDLYRSRIGNVQITLQILKAIIHSCSRDLPLFCSYVLHILAEILKSHDLTLLEESIATFEAFCSSYDIAQFAADSQHVRQHDDVIARYAAFAAKDKPIPRKPPLSVPVLARYRSAGMQSLKTMVTAESFNGDSGRQLRAIIPAMLQSLYSDTPKHLAHLQTLENSKEEYNKEQQSLRRTSLAVKRDRNSPDVDPAAATGTTADVDERSNDEIGVLALQSLRQVFATDNPAQLRIASQCILGFIARRAQSRPELSEKKESAMPSGSNWDIDIFQSVCRWTQVQYRYIVLVAVTDTLTRSPMVESDLANQLSLVIIIDALLCSSTTFIGLSVNDVLIGFIQHVLLLLQLGGNGQATQVYGQLPEAFGLFRVDSGMQRERIPEDPEITEPEVVTQPSALRLELLDQLQNTIGDLATHIYYSDQISEMVTALLVRLKPPIQAIPSAATAIEEPDAAAAAIARSGQLEGHPQTSDFFSFDTARMLALGAVKRILLVANSRRNKVTGSGTGNRVSVATWDGTQWLLCDPDSRVRRAYVDALLTWVSFELDKSNLRIVDEQPTRTVRPKQNGPQTNGNAIAKRAVSNASKVSNLRLKTRSPFLQLLHLAIYENALQYAESEADMLLLHLLLVSMVQNLGVNAVRHGLPMIFRLQEDITSVASPAAKDAIGSLVHGYLWCLTEFFDFDTTIVGRDISNEISRRSQLGLWLSPISVPPIPLARIATPANKPAKPRRLSMTQRTQSLIPFTDRQELVNCISNSYTGAFLSPPSSPPGSPRRPTSSHSNYARRPSYFPMPEERQLPAAVKQQMLSTWTKEAIISDADKHDSRSRSLTDSKTGSGSGRGAGGLLAVDSGLADGINGTPSPDRRSQVDLTENPPLPANGHAMHHRHQIQSHNGVPSSAGSGRTTAVVKVSDLKRILETGVGGKTFTREGASDTGSESMISADVSSIT